MYRLDHILCTTLCALSLNTLFADDVGFAPEQDLHLASPLDSHHTSSFSHDHSHTKISFDKAPSNLSHAIGGFEKGKEEKKKVAIKAFTGKVKGNKVRLRSHADTESAIIKELQKGELLTIVAEQGDFWVVEPSSSMKAYIHRSYVLDDVVEGNRVNVRLQPSIEAPVLTHVHSGEKVSGAICSANNKWMEVSLPAGVHFFVAKQFIENIGSPEVKHQHENRKQMVVQLLESAQYFSKAELEKDYPDIDFDKVSHNYQAIIQDFAEFTEHTLMAKEELALFQEEYIDKRLAFAEMKTQKEQEALAAAEAAFAQKISAITDKMKLWEPIEESLYLSWSTINESRTLD